MNELVTRFDEQPSQQGSLDRAIEFANGALMADDSDLKPLAVILPFALPAETAMLRAAAGND